MDGLNEFLNLDWEAAEAMLEQLIKREWLREPVTRSNRRDGGRISIRQFHRYIRALLRLLVEGPPSADTVRAQTRERVRRFRARRKSNPL
jgi:hypothetical protein